MNDRGVRMTTEGEPMSGETQDVGLLSEDDRQKLRRAIGTMPGSYLNPISEAVERIVAARVAAERERANTAEAKIARLDADYQQLATEANDDSREIERLNGLLRAVTQACPTCHGSGRHKTRDHSCNVCAWVRAALDTPREDQP